MHSKYVLPPVWYYNFLYPAIVVNFCKGTRVLSVSFAISYMVNTKILACILVWSLFFVHIYGYGQKNRTTQKALRANPKSITEFGFTQLYGGVIIVKAAIDNLPDSLNFVLDTGSGGISLDSVTVKLLNIATVPSNRTIRGIAGVKQVQFAYNHTLNFPGLRVDSLDFHINDYEMLSAVYGVRIDGIIGYSFLKRYIVGIDFDKKQVRIYPPGPFTYPAGGRVLRPAISGLPMQYAEVTDNSLVKSRFFIDTGAGLCLLLTDDLVADSSLFAPKKTLYQSVAEGIGGKTSMDVTVIKKFKLGGYKFKKMPAYVFSDDFNVTSYPFLGGLIGNDLLRRFNMTLNYTKGEFHLLPNKSFAEPFDYSYTGFNMLQEGYDVLVMDVIENSPASKAGLENGDVIVSIGNKFASNLQGYKDILQQPGNKIKMVVSRNNKLVEAKLTVGDIRKRKKK